jgi:N-acetylmuramoyl-L-alanine amidase
MRTIFTLILLAFLSPPMNVGAEEKGLIVKGVRYSTYAAFTRVVFEIEAAAPYVVTRSQNGKSIMLGSYEGPFVLKSPLPMVRDSVVAGMEPWEEGGRTYAVIRLNATDGEVKDFTLRSPDRIVLDITKGAAPAAAVLPAEGKTVVVIDPGHGGKDAGLLTGQGLEKTFDLDLAAAIGKILRKTERMKVILTREKDQSLTLDERAAFANSAGASIFVSIHAAPGAEARVYIQDITDDAGAQAAQIRPVSGDFLGYEAGSEQREMVWGKQQAAHAQQSGGLGRKIARRLAGTDSAEPVQAPLAGLKAVDAAAVLIEVGMTGDRARVAEEIARGVEQYVMDSR